MNEESAFLEQLTASPGDETARLVYADWLDEQGQSNEATRQRLMAPGYRAMAQRKMAPRLDGADAEPIRTWFGRQYTRRAGDLPQDWLELMAQGLLEENLETPVTAAMCESTRRDENGSALWVNYASHKLATDAAALTFATLPLSRQAELLEPVEASA